MGGSDPSTQVFRFPKAIRTITGWALAICTVIVMIQIFRQHWPEVTLFTIFSLGSGVLYWLSAFEYTYGPSDLRIQNFLYDKTIPLNEIQSTAYDPHQNALFITYGVDRKRANFLVMGQQLGQLADALQKRWPPVGILQDSSGKPVNLEIKMSGSTLAVHLLLFALSVGMAALFIKVGPGMFVNGIALKDTMIVFGMVMLTFCPFVFGWTIYSSIRNKIVLTSSELLIGGKQYQFQDLVWVEIPGLASTRPYAIKIKFADGTRARIEGWALMKYPQILDLVIESVSKSDRKVSLESSIDRGLAKEMRYIAAFLSLAAIVILLTGIGDTADQRERDRKQKFLAERGVTVEARISENPDSPGVCADYQFDYEGKHYNFTVSGKRDCLLAKSISETAKLTILPDDPSVHIFQKCPTKRSNGYIAIILAVGMFGFVGCLLFKRGLSFDQILTRRRHRFAKNGGAK